MLWPFRTVRMRLTALYCALFVLSGVVLLAITNGVGSISSQSASASSGAPGGGSQQTSSTVTSAR